MYIHIHMYVYKFSSHRGYLLKIFNACVWLRANSNVVCNKQICICVLLMCYIHVCINVHTYICECMCGNAFDIHAGLLGILLEKYMYALTCIYIYVHICTCVCMSNEYKFMYIKSICICAHIHICTCKCACIYIHVYTYVLHSGVFNLFWKLARTRLHECKYLHTCINILV